MISIVVAQTVADCFLQANSEGWEGTSANAGTGNYGTCCSEMDIWEANNNAAAYTPHPCSTDGLARCTGSECTRNTGLCDSDGCDFNSYRMGDKTFLGKGLTVDTSKPFTVVTQFLTSDNSSTGTLSEIRRIYVQGGKVIQNSKVNIPGIDAADSITDKFCDQQKTAFGDTNYFKNHGALAKMGKVLQNGMVLALSIWDDYAANMLWLDSNYPLDKSASTPGVARGTCASTSGVPADVEAQVPNSSVVFSNIKFGDIGTTFSSSSSGGGNTNPTTPTTTATPNQPTTGSGTVAQWGQCGGIGYSGATSCVSPYTCHVVNTCESSPLSAH